MSHIWVQILLYFFIGCTEWCLALIRQELKFQKKKHFVAIIVLLETALGFFVFDKFVGTNNQRDWTIATVYTLGAVAGTYLANTLEEKFAARKTSLN